MKPMIKRCTKIFAVILVMMMCLSGCAGKWQEQYDLGVRYLESGDYEQAILCFKQAIEIDPKSADGYLKLAEVYILLGDMDAAEQVLEDGIEHATVKEALQEMLDKLLAGEFFQEAEESGGESAGTGEASADESTESGTEDVNNVVKEETKLDYAAATGFVKSTEAIFDHVGEYSEGFAIAGNMDASGQIQYFFINEQGERISADYDDVSDFHDGMAVVGRIDADGTTYTYGYINTKGGGSNPLTDSAVRIRNLLFLL